LLSGGAVKLAAGPLEELPDGQRRCVPKGVMVAALALACTFEKDGTVHNNTELKVKTGWKRWLLQEEQEQHPQWRRHGALHEDLDH
jgi:hypothetical protein